MKYIYLIISFLFIISCSEETENNVQEPTVVNDEHFIYILYDDLSQNILEPIQIKLEENYSKVLDDLGIDSMGHVTIHIWGDESNFLDNMESILGARYPGAGGYVRNAQDIRILQVENRTDQNILHEFCHCVTLLVNPQIENNPRWLWEAVALYESGEFVDPLYISYMVNGDFPTIVELNSDFNTNDNRIYRVGYLLSEYIIMNWGKESHINLIKSNGNTLQILEITIEEFEEGWKNFVVEKYLS